MEHTLAALSTKAFALFTLALATASSAAITGNELLERLESSAPTRRAHAEGFVVGVVYGLDNAVQGPPATFCFDLPDRVTSGQMLDVAKAYLRDNPAHRHMPAEIIVLVAMVAAFPCAK